MADKELKHLKRSELIEIIYQLKKNEVVLLKKNAELQHLLEEREVKIENIGSLAEASLALSNIFSAAEESVAIYVNEIKRRYKALEEQEPSELSTPDDPPSQ